MKKIMLLIIVFTTFSIPTFAQAAKKLATEIIPPMQQGIIDMAGDEHSVAKAWLSPKGGWTPYVRVIVHFPGFESSDRMIIQLKKSSSKIGEPYTCKAYTTLKDYSPRHVIPTIRVDLAEFKCRLPKEYTQKGIGTYKVDLSLRQPLADKTTKLGTLEFRVTNVKHGSRNKPTTVQTTSHDTLIGTAYAYEKMGSRGVLKSIANAHYRMSLKRGSSNPIYLKFWSKVDKGASRMSYVAACFYNGKRFETLSGMHQNEESHWSYKGKEDKEQVFWQRHEFVFRNLHVRYTEVMTHNKELLFLDENPGKYECKLLADGKLKGVISFDVKDGKIQNNKCATDLNMPDHVKSVSFVDKGVSNVKIDKKENSKIFYSTKEWSEGCPTK